VIGSVSRASNSLQRKVLTCCFVLSVSTGSWSFTRGDGLQSTHIPESDSVAILQKTQRSAVVAVFGDNNRGLTRAEISWEDTRIRSLIPPLVRGVGSGAGRPNACRECFNPSKDPLLALLLAHSAQVITCELIVDEIAYKWAPLLE
jgi:hypothetical protein